MYRVETQERMQGHMMLLKVFPLRDPPSFPPLMPCSKQVTVPTLKSVDQVVCSNHSSVTKVGEGIEILKK